MKPRQLELSESAVWCQNMDVIGVVYMHYSTQLSCPRRCTKYEAFSERMMFARVLLEPTQSRVLLEPLDAAAGAHWTRQRAKWAGLDFEDKASAGQHHVPVAPRSVACTGHVSQLCRAETHIVLYIFRFYRVPLVRGVYAQLFDVASKANVMVSYPWFELLAVGKSLATLHLLLLMFQLI